MCVCVYKEPASPGEVRGSQMWSRRDLNDAVTSTLYLAAFFLLAASGMHFSRVSSPQPRSDC